MMILESMSATDIGNLVEIIEIIDILSYLRILEKNLLISARKIGIENNLIFEHHNIPKYTKNY